MDGHGHSNTSVMVIGFYSGLFIYVFMYVFMLDLEWTVVASSLDEE